MPQKITKNMDTGFQPTSGKNRILLIDALRGCALLGIILANIPVAFNYMPAGSTGFSATATGEEALKAILHILISTKFITLFSILFGAGFYLQLQKAARRGIALGPGATTAPRLFA